MALKTEIEEVKKQRERLEKINNEVQAENKKLVEPLQRAQEQVSELQRQLSSYDKDKALLAVWDFSFSKKFPTSKEAGLKMYINTYTKYNSLCPSNFLDRNCSFEEVKILRLLQSL